MKAIFLLLFAILRIDALWLPKIIWTYWNEPIQPDTYLELFHLNHMRFKGDWELRILNKKNFKEVLNQIPDFQGLPWNFQTMIAQHQADFLRLLLLYYYGGVWIDFSMIMTEDLSWLQLQKLRNIPQLIGRHLDEPDLLFFNFQIGKTQKYISPVNKQEYWVSPRLQIWFIACKPKTKFLRDLLDVAYDVQEHKKTNQSYWQDILKEKKINTRSNNDYLFIGQAFQYIFQTKQRELDAQENNRLERQLAVLMYKIWHIPCWLGPFGYLKSFEDFAVIEPLMLSQISEKKLNRNGIGTRFFIKLIADDRYYFQKFTKYPKLQANIKKIFVYPLSMPEFLCSYFQGLKFQKDSIVAKYLFSQNDKIRNFQLTDRPTLYLHPCQVQKYYQFIALIVVIVQALIIIALFVLTLIFYRRYTIKVKLGVQGQQEEDGKLIREDSERSGIKISENQEIQQNQENQEKIEF